jgi:hypothetical protein
MSFMTEVFAETGGDFLVRGFYAIMFFLLALCSLAALVNHVRLEFAARQGFRVRSLLMRAFFEAYEKRGRELEEADTERERKSGDEEAEKA